jgi:hypothetical protein
MGARVAESLSTFSGLGNDEYVILAGKAYYKKLLPMLNYSNKV